MFTVLVLGRSPNRDCKQVSPTQFLFSLENSSQILDMAVFIENPLLIPQDTGCLIYFSRYPYQNWNVLGYLSSAKPSEIFSIKKEKEDVVSTLPAWQFNASHGTNDTIAQVGIEIVPIKQIEYQFSERDINENKLQTFADYCKKMLQSFYNYGQSFIISAIVDPYTNAVENVIPAKVFDQWYTKFEQKLLADPYFWK